MQRCNSQLMVRCYFMNFILKASRLFYRPLILVSVWTEASLTPASAISRCIYLQDRAGVDLEGVSVINGDISH